MQNGINIVSNIWRLLNDVAVLSLLNGGDVWQHNRPRNSKFTDVVISIDELNSGSMDSGFVNVNIHTPNQQLNILHKDGQVLQDSTFPDLPVFAPLLDLVLSFITTTQDYVIQTKVAGIPIRDKDGEWYVNIKVGFEAINTDQSFDVSLISETSQSDGYGGSIVALSNVWDGKGVRLKMKDSTQVNTSSKRFELNIACNWILPEDANPQKNNQLAYGNERYVINGILPLNGFYELITVRKDV